MAPLEAYQNKLAAKSYEVDDPEMLIARQGAISVQYAPFEHIRRSARIAIVGITPGRSQANAALSKAHGAVKAGHTVQEALRIAKDHASFSGPMRKNLFSMLDYIGVSRWLGMPSTESLWHEHVEKVHFTSALRFPVFIEGKDYSGSSPSMTASPILRDQLMTWFREEMAALPNVLWVPLGDKVYDAISFVAREANISAHILRGLPHPSGANAERVAYFLDRKSAAQLSIKTNPKSIDTGKQMAFQVMQKLMDHKTGPT
jgi:hypothetical protein